MVLERCSTTLKLEANSLNRKRKSKWFEELSSWFEEDGRSIFLRGKKCGKHDCPWYIFILPAECLYQSFIHQQHINNNNNNKNSSIDKMFHHSFHHTFPAPFDLPFITIPPEFYRLYEASWVVFGSTIYFFVKTGEIFYLERNVAGTTFISPVSFKTAGRMRSKRKEPKIVALDNKIYIFGGSTDLFCEVFELDQGRLGGQSRCLLSPLEHFSCCDVQFAIAIEKGKRIVVGIRFKFVDAKLIKVLYPDFGPTSGTALFVYDVVGGSWIKHTSNFLFNNVEKPLCHPIAVGSCLYWLDTKMWAYDLTTKQYFEGPIEDCLFQKLLLIGNEADILSVSLLHLVGDFFCMTWDSANQDRVVHCTTIQALRTTTNLQANRFKLRTTVFSCQTFASRLPTFMDDSALVL